MTIGRIEISNHKFQINQNSANKKDLATDIGKR